jgi:hypothetical protein
MGEMAEFYINVENGGCDQCGEIDCVCDQHNENDDKEVK